jgi:hypothetical protein
MLHQVPLTTALFVTSQILTLSGCMNLSLKLFTLLLLHFYGCHFYLNVMIDAISSR